MPRASKQDRQQWIHGAERYCAHASTEEIYNQGGAVIAITCRGCGVRIAEIGDCDGCDKKHVALSSFLITGPRPRRFHNSVCRQLTLTREKDERARWKSKGQAAPSKGPAHG